MSTTFPTYIDSTMRASWVSCPHKFWRSHIEHWTLAEPSIHLHAGATLAKGLEVIRNLHFGFGQSIEEALPQAVGAMIIHWGDFDLSWDHQKGLARVCLGLIEYLNQWPPQSDYLLPLMQQGAPSVEFSFAVPLPLDHPETGDPLLYVGRSDMLAKYNDQLFVVDEKTTSQLGASWRAKWDLRAQFTGYCWAAKQYEYPVAGVVVRGISFLKGGYGFEEALTYRADWQIQEWYSTLINDVQDMISAWRGGRWRKALDDACESYGGCEFKRLCTSPNPDEWLPVYYKARTWNPLEKDFNDELLANRVPRSGGPTNR